MTVRSISSITWDGDQVLIEDRTDGSTNSNYLNDETHTGGLLGRVMYTHGAGLDSPLNVIKGSTYLSLHANWRGQYEAGHTSSGTPCSASSGCASIAWPGGASTAEGRAPQSAAATDWVGNLITGSADGSGLQYRRNRYYDPATGRFTQADPIGLGGGTNLYGFANGDPVNNTDPFGLCVPFCSALALAEGGALAGTAVFPGVGTVVGAVAGAVVGAIGGIFAGKWLAGKMASEQAAPLPGGLTGTEPRETAGRINTTGSGNPEETFDKLTGGTSTTSPEGHRVGANGVRLRAGTATEGPRIDIPAKGARKHETVHYPPTSP